MKQYKNLMNGEIGYEHYFINYYLYLPFSMAQEKKVIEDTLKIMFEMKLIKSISENSTESIAEKELLLKVANFFHKLNNISQYEAKEIKRKITLQNKQRTENLTNEISKEFKQIFPNFISNLLTNLNTEEIQFYENNKENLQNIVYGDYKLKNENVEVYLHQRTTKKVKYKKREYNLIHPIDKKLIETLIKK